MFLYIIIIALLCLAGVLLARHKNMVNLCGMMFFVAQISMAVNSVINLGINYWTFFTLDHLGVTYLCMMSVMGLLTAWRSMRYLDSESLRHRKIYFTSLILLSITLIGVYLSNNLAVTWIFLEATTVATAGLTYHRRTGRALEATWKYIFVSSVGIAIAYLGVLLLSTASPDTLSYSGLSTALADGGNSLYLRLAFLFILVGYSTKLEIFPLFTVGVDANHSAPTPASAFISSALVGGGFVALFRVYRVMEHSSEIQWVRGVLIVVALLSIVAAAVYLGRTNNYKRLLAYSTLENSGLTMLGLGLGGVGVVAALLHSMAHTMIKGVSYLQMSIVGRMFHTYRIGRIGGYAALDTVGSIVITLSLVALIAMPPSVLFRSEFMMLSQLLNSPLWWLIILIGLPLLVCLYWIVSKALQILYRPIESKTIDRTQNDTALSWILLAVIGVVFYFGAVDSYFLTHLIQQIVNQ
ncbi:MAG: proton-conducting transporter membrane subunit [Mucinivorans sp.]